MTIVDETVAKNDFAYFEKRIASLEKTAKGRGWEMKQSFFIYLFISAVIAIAVTFAAAKIDFRAALATKDSIGFALGAVALTLIVGWFGFVALKRLELYDEEMSRIRELLDTRSDKLRKDQRADFKTLKEGFGADARTQIDRALRAASEDQEAKIKLLSDMADQTVAKLERYDSLLTRAAAETSVHLEQGMLSLEAVHDEVQNLFNKASAFNGLISQQIEADPSILAKRDAIRAEAICIVRQALEKDVQGDAADYHNFAAELGRNNYYVLAVEALERGIKRFPANTDLIADAVQMALGAGDLNLTDTYYARLRKIDWRKWTWRGFSFSIKYLIAKGDEEEAQELYGKALEYMPFDERPVVQYTQLFLERGQTDKAMAILEECYKRLKSAPQVAYRLAEIYKDLGKYADCIAMGLEALRMDVQDQSQVNNAAIHLTIGFSGEALWCERFEKLPQTELTDEISTDLFRQSRSFLVHYAAALTSADCAGFTRRAIALRLATVRSNLLFLGWSTAICDQYFAELGLSAAPTPSKDDE